MVCEGESIETTLKKSVSWRPPFLTVRISCGSGNSWTCNEQVLYKVERGSAVRLGKIGDYLPGAKEPLFLKTFDWFEVNALVAHLGRPVRLVLRLKRGRLQYDPELTWILNYEAYEENQMRMLHCGPRKYPPCDDLDYKIALLFNATVVKVTGRDAQFKRALARAKRGPRAGEHEVVFNMLMRVDPISVQQWIDRAR
jgi:hypothetical protein